MVMPGEFRTTKVAAKVTGSGAYMSELTHHKMCQAKRLAIGFLALGVVFAGSGPASAETLAQALAWAYEGNPLLRAERARQRGTDEQVPQALSGWRPTIVANGDVGVQHNDTNTTPSQRTDPAGFTIELNQPIFRGFRTINQTKSAEANVRAGRQNLLAVEQELLFDTVQAFADVVRDRQIVHLRTKNVSFLVEQLKAAKARFEVGEITRTDVSQSNARLSLSRSNLSNARSNLETNRAIYTRLTGRKPGRLTKLKVLRRLPKTLSRAIAIAERTNPTILSAVHIEEAARHDIKTAKGDLLPTLSLQARYQLRHDPSTFTRTSEAAQVLGALSVPLYQSGLQYSQVRQAKQVASQRRLQILNARRQVRERVVTGWHALIATRQTIRSFADQVRANRFALEGVRQEALVGSRTTLDVLDAEQELVDSQVSLAGARRDNIVAAYLLLGSIGKLTATDLRLPVAVYDPTRHYDATRDRLFGTSTETIE